jgi:hypothetical protein
MVNSGKVGLHCSFYFILLDVQLLHLHTSFHKTNHNLGKTLRGVTNILILIFVKS